LLENEANIKVSAYTCKAIINEKCIK